MPPFLALDKHLLMNPCNNPVGRYCYYAHFTNEQTGTERLRNTVTQLVSGKIRILAQRVEFAQNARLLHGKHQRWGCGDASVNFSFYQNNCHQARAFT